MYFQRTISIIFLLSLLFFSIFFLIEYSNIFKFIEDILLKILSQKEKNYIYFFALLVLLNFFYFLTPLPVSPLLLLNGFVFGWFGFVFSMFFILVGSIFIFSFSKTFLKKSLSNIPYANFLKLKIKNYKFIKKTNNTVIFLSRYIIPYFFHNILFGLYNIKLRNFFLIILLAEVPLTLAINNIGDSLKSFVMINNYTIAELLFNSKFIAPFIFILCIILMSSTFKKIIVKQSN